jgi:Ras-related protein Rab-8A
MLVGNKTDLPNREVSYDEGLALATKLGLSYMETSAKQPNVVNDAFRALGLMLLSRGPRATTAEAVPEQ